MLLGPGLGVGVYREVLLGLGEWSQGRAKSHRREGREVETGNIAI